MASLEYLDAVVGVGVGDGLPITSQLSRSVCPLPVGRADSVRIVGR